MWSISTFIFVGLAAAVHSGPLISNENVETTIITSRDTTATDDLLVNDSSIGGVEATKTTLVRDTSDETAAATITASIANNPSYGEGGLDNDTIFINKTFVKKPPLHDRLAKVSTVGPEEPINVTLHGDEIQTEPVTHDTVANDYTVGVEAIEPIPRIGRTSVENAAISDTLVNRSSATLTGVKFTEDDNVKVVTSTNATSSNSGENIGLVVASTRGGWNVENVQSNNNKSVHDPLVKYDLSEGLLINKLRFLMRKEVCRNNKPLALDAILPDILKGAKAGNCKYKCERYYCETCVNTDYKDTFVAGGNCSIWSDGLQFVIDYTGELNGDLLSYNIYFETTVGDEEPKLYKSGMEEAGTIDHRFEAPTSMPSPVASYIIHALLSG